MLSLVSKPGSALSVLSGLLALGAVIAAAIVSIPRSASLPVPTEAQLRSALVRAGLGPGELAAIGATSLQTSALVAAARDHLITNFGALRSADATASSAGRQAALLAQVAERGTATQEQLLALASAREQLAAAQSAQQGALDNLFTAAAEGLSAEQRGSLLTIRANRGREAPLQYRLTSRTDAQWVALRESLMQESQAERNQTVVPVAAADLLADCRDEPGTSSATTALAQNGASIEHAWSSAIQNP